MKDLLLRITLGIPAPKNEPTSVNEMRLAIGEASRDSTLVNRCLMNARYQGLSGEDTYVGLAYYALRELERLWKLQQSWDACTLRAVITRMEEPK
jgi:hypothetical protein